MQAAEDPPFAPQLESEASSTDATISSQNEAAAGATAEAVPDAMAEDGSGDKDDDKFAFIDAATNIGTAMFGVYIFLQIIGVI